MFANNISPTGRLVSWSAGTLLAEPPWVLGFLLSRSLSSHRGKSRMGEVIGVCLWQCHLVLGGKVVTQHLIEAAYACRVIKQ